MGCARVGTLGQRRKAAKRALALRRILAAMLILATGGTAGLHDDSWTLEATKLAYLDSIRKKRKLDKRRPQGGDYQRTELSPDVP